MSNTHIIYITHVTHTIKLIFKAYKKRHKIFFFLYIKMLTGYYQKNKEKLSKKARERYQNLSEEEKKRSLNMVVDNIKIF